MPHIKDCGYRAPKDIWEAWGLWNDLASQGHVPRVGMTIAIWQDKRSHGLEAIGKKEH